MQYAVGEEVKINDGPFANLNGRIDEIDPDAGQAQDFRLHFRPVHAGRARILAGAAHHRVTRQRALRTDTSLVTTMAKKIQGYIRLQLPAGAANPAPPVGPALGAQGVNIMAFCKEFNAKTKDQNGMILPVIITVYADKSFTFILKSPPASVLLKKAANIASGSAKPNQDKVGKVTRKQLLEIYRLKQKDLNANNDEAGIRIIAGTARNMGIEVVD